MVSSWFRTAVCFLWPFVWRRWLESALEAPTYSVSALRSMLLRTESEILMLSFRRGRLTGCGDLEVVFYCPICFRASVYSCLYCFFDGANPTG
jgi:hypothetical protein